MSFKEALRIRAERWVNSAALQRVLRRCAWLVALTSVVACHDAAPQACVPGMQSACACPGGGVGIQLCREDGLSLAPCVSCAVADQGVAADLRAPEDLTPPPDLAMPRDLAQPPDMTSVAVIQPGPQDGKDTCWGTVYATGGKPTDSDLDVGGWGDFYYDYFEFPLSGSPSAAQTMQASVQFYFSVSVNNPALQVYRITEPWTAAGVSRAANPAATLVGAFGSSVVPAGFHSVDITALYKGWKDGSYPNYGIKLVPTSSNQTNGLVAASENPDPARRPKLTITYLNQ